ncbi:glycosyltransferase [Shimia thalassica]|uniref:glycosyltransferase n=1 Tax=Shimia thalassica TaxID=1715693 RepID=UPI0026E3EB6B|nr:glycosyltransferase [Shimia thalassica]MDO6479806.1 glycosyltransferase [Shimia thalassica]
MTGTVGVVVIGRNEGARLIACLASLANQDVSVVYVDSGSDDNSVAEARKAGATIVDLDTTVPFTAARARNAGVDALRRVGLPTYIQFIDGDCIVVSDWIEKARHALDQNADMGIVTGWRSEIYPTASIYNDLCEFEWHRPAGDITACGGDMMVRSQAFEMVGGFNPSVIAAEDDEFCIRVGAAGWRLHRLPESMTRHDANMTRFDQWWQRAIRSGHGFAQVGHLHPDYFVPERRRVWVFGAILPVLALVGLVTSLWLTAIGVVAYALSYWRTKLGLIQSGLLPERARRHAVYLTLSKVPNLRGMLTFYWRHFKGRSMNIIEYK